MYVFVISLSFSLLTKAIPLQLFFDCQLFHMAVQSKRMGLRQGKLDHWLWDKLVFNKIKARLGGHVRCIVTGSAPISPDGFLLLSSSLIFLLLYLVSLFFSFFGDIILSDGLFETCVLLSSARGLRPD